MVCVVVTFRFGEDFDAARIREVAKAARGEHHGKPGLRSKLFSIDSELREAVQLYLWDSEDAAHHFFTPARLELITALYGVKPTVRFDPETECSPRELEHGLEVVEGNAEVDCALKPHDVCR